MKPSRIDHQSRLNRPASICFISPLLVPVLLGKLKYKLNQGQEFVISGYTMGGNPFDALIVGCYDRGKLRYVGKVRAGFGSHIRCAMFPLFRKRVTKECPFCGPA